MQVENATYDGSATLTVVGEAGLFKGEKAVVHLGQRLVVGRSRMCDISVARAPECLRLGREALERHKSYRKISRKHLSVTLLHPEMVEVEDLSTNGTLVGGHRVDRLLITDFRKESKTLIIEFGEGERLRVTVGSPRAEGGRPSSASHGAIDTDSHVRSGEYDPASVS